MRGQRFQEERSVYIDFPVRVSLTNIYKNWLKPQCANFSPLASDEGWGGIHSLCEELYRGCLSSTREQNLQDFDHCHYLGLGVAATTFWCNSSLHSSSVLEISKYCHACVAFLMNRYM